MTNELIRYIRHTLLPSKCLACGAILPDDEREHALCHACACEWEEQCHTPCGTCGREVALCRCISNDVKSSLIAYSMSCIMFESDISKKLIYRLKHKRNKRLAAFFAMQISANIFTLQKLHFDNCVIVYPQRSQSGKYSYGFDHARLLAVGTERITGIKVSNIVGKRGNHEQKRLGAGSRLENAFSSFYLKKGKEYDGLVKGKDVIIIDDIVTTGSTALCLAALVHNAGAKSISLFTVAKAPLGSKNKNDGKN